MINSICATNLDIFNFNVKLNPVIEIYIYSTNNANQRDKCDKLSNLLKNPKFHLTFTIY